MALQQTIENSTGTTATYWRIVLVTTNYESSQANILMYGYKDQTARNQNKTPVDQRSYIVKGDDFDTWYGISELDITSINHVLNSYFYIKQIPNGEFTNATDLL